MPLTNPPFLGSSSNNAAVNGDVDISQELGTTGATLTNNTAKYTADCWEGYYNHAAATAVVTSGQVAAASFVTVLPAFSFGHRIKATTAISSPASGDFARHRSKIEGYRIARWGWGATGAKQVVVAFQYYSTASGVAFVKLSNSDQSRCYYHEITVAAGWNFYSFMVPGDTTGTWGATNGIGLTFEVFSSGKETTPASSLDAWGATNKVQTTNSTNLLVTNNNETVITGLYIDAINSLPTASDLPQLMRQWNEDLPLCKRYFNRMAASGVNQPFAMLQAFSTTAAFGVLRYLDVPLRGGTPTAVVSNVAHIGLGDATGGGAVAITGASVAVSTIVLYAVSLSGSSGLAAGNAVQTIFLSASGYIDAIDRL